MMRLLLFYPALLLMLFSCESAESTLADKFQNYIFSNHPHLKTGKQLLFIVNKPECPPCIEAIEKTMAYSYEAKKNVVLFGHRAVSAPKGSRILTDNEERLASYGMLGVDGTICVFIDGALVGSLPFDTQNPEAASAEIRKLLKTSGSKVHRSVR